MTLRLKHQSHELIDRKRADYRKRRRKNVQNYVDAMLILIWIKWDYFREHYPFAHDATVFAARVIVFAALLIGIVIVMFTVRR